MQLYLKGRAFKMHPRIHSQPGKGEDQYTVNTLGKHLHLALENPKTKTDLTFRAGQNLWWKERTKLARIDEKQVLFIVSMVAYTYDPSTLETKRRELPQVQEQPLLYSEFQSSLSYTEKDSVSIPHTPSYPPKTNILYMINIW